MRRTLAFVFAAALLASPAAASIVLVEDFEAPFPAWESGWLGTNSNLTNYYGVGAGRGNNPDGLWLDDGDAVKLGDEVDIQFDGVFGSALTSLSIDVTGWIAGTFRIYDSLGATLLTAAIPTNQGAFVDPGSYTTFSVLSATGIGGFSFISQSEQLEGNTSIDNVIVAVGAVPEPASLLLFAAGALGLLAKERRRG